MNNSPPEVPRADYGIVVVYAVLCIAVGLFDFLGFLGSTGWAKTELGFDSVVYFATGVLLLRRLRIAYPALFVGFVPIILAVAQHGIYIGHLLAVMVIFGMIVYVKRRTHLLHEL